MSTHCISPSSIRSTRLPFIRADAALKELSQAGDYSEEQMREAKNQYRIAAMRANEVHRRILNRHMCGGIKIVDEIEAHMKSGAKRSKAQYNISADIPTEAEVAKIREHVENAFIAAALFGEGKKTRDELIHCLLRQFGEIVYMCVFINSIGFRDMRQVAIDRDVLEVVFAELGDAFLGCESLTDVRDTIFAIGQNICVVPA